MQFDGFPQGVVGNYPELLKQIEELLHPGELPLLRAAFAQTRSLVPYEIWAAPDAFQRIGLLYELSEEAYSRLSEIGGELTEGPAWREAQLAFVRFAKSHPDEVFEQPPPELGTSPR